MRVPSNRCNNQMQKRESCYGLTGYDKKTPCYILMKCPSSSLVSPSCWWQVGGFVIPLYPSNTMTSLFMIQFAMPSDRSFVLISCCFALRLFSLMIFIFFHTPPHLQEDKRAVDTAHQQMDISICMLLFLLGVRGSHCHLIYKIKSNKDLRREIINGICDMQAKRVVSRNERWCAISNEQDGKDICVTLFIFLQQGLINTWVVTSVTVGNNARGVPGACSISPSSNLAMDLCLSREAGLGQNQFLLHKQLIPEQLCV